MRGAGEEERGAARVTVCFPPRPRHPGWPSPQLAGLAIAPSLSELGPGWVGRVSGVQGAPVPSRCPGGPGQARGHLLRGAGRPVCSGSRGCQRGRGLEQTSWGRQGANGKGVSPWGGRGPSHQWAAFAGRRGPGSACRKWTPPQSHRGCHVGLVGGRAGFLLKVHGHVSQRQEQPAPG